VHGQTSRVSSLKFNLKITFNNKLFNYVIFYLQLKQYSDGTRPQFNNIESLLFIKWNFTTNAHNVLSLNHCAHWHVLSQTVLPCHRSQGGWEWRDSRKNCVGEMSLHFQSELKTLGFLSFPTDKNLKDWGPANMRAVPRKISADIYWYGLVSCFGGLKPWRFCKHFKYILNIKS
jgi:hypothetical protein